MNLEGERTERMLLHNLWKIRCEPEQLISTDGADVI